MALQRAKLRVVHDVRPPGWSRSGKDYAPGFVWRFCRFVSDSFSRIPHGIFDGPTVLVTGNPPSGEPLGADCPRCGIHRAVGFRAWPTGADHRVAKADSLAYAVFIAVPLVPAAVSDIADQGPGDSAEPLQFGRAGGNAFGPVSLDHQLLCPPPGGECQPIS